MQRGQGVGSEYVEGGQRVGGEWAESVLVREGYLAQKKAHFWVLGSSQSIFCFGSLLWLRDISSRKRAQGGLTIA